MSEKIVNKLNMPSFRSIPFFSTGKAQTIAAYLYPSHARIPHSRHDFVPLPDGDMIAVTENRPAQWMPDHRTVLLVHGLTGSHQSRYMVRATHLLLREGYQVVRMDLRGCGAGREKAKLTYHAGRSDDPRQVIAWLAKQYPHSPVTVIGFSLGANMILKMAGENGKEKHTGNITTQQSLNNLDSLIAISPPVDLFSCIKRLMLPENKWFDRYFTKTLLKEIKVIKEKTEKTDNIFVNKETLEHSIRNLYEFDEKITAPMNGFDNALDYYQQSSALPWLSSIQIPTLIIQAKDDPVVCHAAIEDLPLLPHLELLITQQGGHVGWIGPSGDFSRYGYQWMNRVLVEWIKQC